MRYVIYGAGAIGGAVGVLLHHHGEQVVLIARGRQLDALRDRGLMVHTPDGELSATIPACGSPRDVEMVAADVVLLTVKSQDTAQALLDLRAVADPDVAVVCAQNGVENERLALRLFSNVYGMFVYVSAQYLEPGLVQLFSSPTRGVLDLGRTPAGGDERAEQIAADLKAAGFASQVDAQIMRMKYAKLLANLANAVEALLGPTTPAGDIVRGARAEGLACYAAAGIDCASDEELRRRVAGKELTQPVNGLARRGGSSWQSLARPSGGIETDYLNGEIVLLGRLHGIPTPVNEALCSLARQTARDRTPPGSLDRRKLDQVIETLKGSG